MLYPAFRMQTEMMNAVGGQAWWNSKKGKLANEKEEAKQKEYAERVAQAQLIDAAAATRQASAAVGHGGHGRGRGGGSAAGGGYGRGFGSCPWDSLGLLLQILYQFCTKVSVL